MLLSEINGEYQKKRMIVYNADGTKPIVHNIEVAPIFGNIYMSRLEKSDTRSYAACDLYLYLEDRGVGLLVGMAAEDDSLELVEGQIRRYRVGSADEFLAMIRDCINTGSYISLIYIELVKLLDESIVPECFEARKIFAEKQRAKREAERAQREAEEAAYVKERNEAAQKKVAQAIETLKNGGRLVNFDVEIFKSRYNSSSYSIFNYLARQYGVKIPIKTQGWINSSLLDITVEEKRLRKKWKKPENFSGFFLLLGKQNQVFIGSYSVEAKRRLKSTCWRSKQEQISDRRPVFFRLKKRFSVFVICFWLASATKNCSDS